MGCVPNSRKQIYEIKQYIENETPDKTPTRTEVYPAFDVVAPTETASDISNLSMMMKNQPERLIKRTEVRKCFRISQEKILNDCLHQPERKVGIQEMGEGFGEGTNKENSKRCGEVIRKSQIIY